MKTIIQTEAAPAAIGPYSQAVKIGQTVYLSGQIPLDPATMTLVSQDVEGQAEQVMLNLKSVCAAAGGNFDQIVKLTIYMMDLNDFATVNEVMAKHFNEPYPARATIQVAGLPKGALVEIEAVMVVE